MTTHEANIGLVLDCADPVALEDHLGRVDADETHRDLPPVPDHDDGVTVEHGRNDDRPGLRIYAAPCADRGKDGNDDRKAKCSCYF